MFKSNHPLKNSFFQLIIIICVISIHKSVFAQVQITPIHKDWQFKQTGEKVWQKAEVPGCVHTDLMSNQKIADPYYRDNERGMQWIGEKDWDYQTTFNVSDSLLKNENVNLVFEGLDTYADVYINDVKVLEADNMHRKWIIDCKNIFHKGINKLAVHFNSVFKVDVPKYLNAPFKLQAFPNNDQGDLWLSLYARKAGYEYGWDWGPRLITSGIWRPVYIETWNNARIENVEVIQQEINKKFASIKAVYQIASTEDKSATLSITDHEKIIAHKTVNLKKGINKFNIDFKIPKPHLWWPNGLGDPYLYTFNYSLKLDNNTVDSKSIATGLRTVKVIRQPDKDGRSFYFEVNDVPVFIKGSNYIPIDNFVNRVTPQRYEAVIKSAKDANMNMLRVWGGGIYENDLFYDLCDQNGLLVWQDLMFACGMFPSDSAFINNVKEEVRQNVTRLRNHSSIALWCGNNENEIAWYRWGWSNKYPIEVQKEYEASMINLFHKTLPDVINTVDSSRYYHTSSPNAGFKNTPIGMGDSHYYGVWNSGEPFVEYNHNVARFMSEYGFQSFPDYKSVEKFTEPADREIMSSVMLAHQRAKDNETRNDFGNKNIKKYMDMYFKEPKDFKSFLYVSQLLQSKAILTAIEAHRSKMPYCMGTMYWQLNDCWPVASWSSTDYYGNWKALHYTVKKAYQKDIITINRDSGKIKVNIITDRLTPTSSVLSLKLMDFNGNIINNKDLFIKLKPNTSGVYFETDDAPFLKGSDENHIVLSAKLIIKADTLATKNYFFKEEKDIVLEKSTLKSSITGSVNNYLLHISTNKIVRNLYLDIPGQEVFFSDNYFDLLPGETKTVSITLKNNKPVELNKIKMMSLVDTYDINKF